MYNIFIHLYGVWRFVFVCVVRKTNAMKKRAITHLDFSDVVLLPTTGRIPHIRIYKKC